MRAPVHTHLILLALAGCQAVKGLGPATPVMGAYVNREAHFSLRLPMGWAATKRLNPFEESPHLVSFETANGAATATVTRVPLRERSCADAGRETLITESGAVARSEKAFALKTVTGDLPAWRAATERADGSRRGEAALFCEGSSAILLAATADKAAYGDYKYHLDAIVDSFSYVSGREEVKVRPEEPDPSSQYFVHTVKWRGQTLAQIAQWFTGKRENWKKLTNPVNEDLTVGDVPLKVGRQVKIPPDMLTRQDPMPEPKPPRQPRPAKVRQGSEPGERKGAESPGGEEADPQEQEEEPPALPSVIGPK